MDKKTAGIGKGTPGPGRPKGRQNKVTTTAKDAIAMAADRLGGTDRLVEWVKEAPENERIFWGSIYTRLLPLQVGGDPDAPLQVQIVRYSPPE